MNIKFTKELSPNALLSEKEVHLWVTKHEEITNPKLLQYYHSLMNEKESIQQQRYIRQKDQHQYLVTRALIRTTLSLYAPITPKDWIFSHNKYGRPKINMNDDYLNRIHFNISHSKGFIVCIIGKNLDVGVDVESTQRVKNPVSIADRFFSPFEIQELYNLSVHKRRERFFQYWTLGEAYIKARGMGLAIPLDQFSFHLNEPNNITISFDQKINDNPQLWQFEQIYLSPQYLLAIALKHSKQQQLPIKMKYVIPS